MKTHSPNLARIGWLMRGAWPSHPRHSGTRLDIFCQPSVPYGTITKLTGALLRSTVLWVVMGAYPEFPVLAQDDQGPAGSVPAAEAKRSSALEEPHPVAGGEPLGSVEADRPFGPASPPQQRLSQALRVRSGPTCLDEARLETSVERWLERTQIDARIHVLVYGGPGEHDVRFTVHRDDGTPAERVLRDAPQDCGSLHNAVALSIALAIDATLLDRFELPDDEDLTEVQRKKSLLELRLPTSEPHMVQVRLGLAGGVTAGFVTQQAFAARVAVYALLLRWLELRASGLFTRAEDQRLPGVGGQFAAQVWAARGDLCAVVQATRWLTAAGCAGFQAGTFITTSTGFAEDRDGAASALWATGLGVEARVQVTGWLELAAFADLSLKLSTRTLGVLSEDASPPPPGSTRSLPLAGVMIGLGPVLRVF